MNTKAFTKLIEQLFSSPHFLLQYINDFKKIYEDLEQKKHNSLKIKFIVLKVLNKKTFKNVNKSWTKIFYQIALKHKNTILTTNTASILSVGRTYPGSGDLKRGGSSSVVLEGAEAGISDSCSASRKEGGSFSVVLEGAEAGISDIRRDVDSSSEVEINVDFDLGFSIFGEQGEDRVNYNFDSNTDYSKGDFTIDGMVNEDNVDMNENEHEQLHNNEDDVEMNEDQYAQLHNNEDDVEMNDDHDEQQYINKSIENSYNSFKVISQIILYGIQTN